MPRSGLMLAAVVIAALLVAPASASVPETPAAVFSPDRVIVEWAPGASPVERRAAREEADVDFTRDLGDRRFQLVETEPGQTPREAVRELRADPAVALAVRDGYDVEHAIPDDPLFDQLWGLRNTGLGVYGFAGAVAGADIDAIGAWDRTVGIPATVAAVLDGGYRFEHPDLADVAWTNPGETLDAVDNDANGIVDDVHGADFIGANAETPATDGDPTDDDLFSGGHGVHTAGTIGAEGNNGIGITGVAQDVSIMPLRVCSRFPLSEERGCPHSAQIAAINYAGAKGARVANMSLGGKVHNPALANAIAATPQTLFVVSAGNEEENNELHPKYPCNFDPPGEGRGAVDNVICVAATDQADELAWFSNWGASSVDLGAPGTETRSTYPSHGYVEDSFEIDDFADKWSVGGPDGGFARTNEPPLTSFGITDSPGAPPGANSSRASTSAPVTLPAGLQSCVVEMTRWVTGSHLWVEILLDGELVQGIGSSQSGRFSHDLGDALSEGGEVNLRLGYTTGPNPGSGNGVWVDDVELRCRAHLGEADGYRFLQGTSMAAPHVTGAAALLFSLKPSASVTEVRQALLGSVDPLPALAGITTSGGRLDAAAALDLFDAVPPPAPALSATVPSSPSSNSEPRLIGSAQRGTSVEVYDNPTCSGTALAGGSAAQLAGPGIAVSAADNTTTEFSVTATDLAPHTSTCSAPISYTRGKGTIDPGEEPTDPGGGDGGPAVAPDTVILNPEGLTPPLEESIAPACIVPRLAGKTLARAKRALRAAGCKLGTVRKRKRKPRKGKRPPPLVVKFSAPAADLSPTDGRVNLTLGPKPKRKS